MCLVGRGNIYGLEMLYVWLGEVMCMVWRGNVFGWAR